MLFHENCLLADMIPYFSGKLRKMSQNLSSAAVVIGALRVNPCPANNFCPENLFYSICCIYSNALQYTFTMVVNIMNPDQTAPRSSLIRVHIVCNIGNQST